MSVRVAMLVNNDWRHDSRVIREAEALAERGYDVHVVCRRVVPEPVVECHGGVRYHVVPHATSRAAIVAALKAHVALTFDLRLFSKARPSAVVQLIIGHLLTLAGGVVLGCLALALGTLWLARWTLADRRRPQTPQGAAALQTSAGRTPTMGARLIAVHALQPFTYLNDFAAHGVRPTIALAPDVVHAHDLVTLSGGALVARRRGCRLVYDAHELERHTNYHSLNPWTRFWIAAYESLLSREANAVITVCDGIADWLARAYRISRPAVVLNAPKVRSPILDGDRRGPDVRHCLGVPDGTPLVVYVGSVTIDRGLELCVRALADLPGVHFATVGPRYAVTEAAMLAAARDVAVEQRLHLVPAVSSDEVMRFISTADCSVLPIQNVCLSYYFCFPNKLLESVLAGVPVAVADLPELRRFVEDFGVGVVMDETDPRAIAAAIRTVLEARDRYRPSRDRILEIEDRFGWARQQARLLALYERLVCGSIVAGASTASAEPRAANPRAGVTGERSV